MGIDNIIKNYIGQTLNKEYGSLIKRPMLWRCKVAVLIPVYNEDFETILRTLRSLSEQEGACAEDFEIDLIINNSQEEAGQNAFPFLQNRRAIELIRYIQDKNNPVPAELSERHHWQIETIRANSLSLNLIDKSSFLFAEKENNVGIARNRAGAEICQRFLKTQIKEKGIIALLDADTRVSPNYIRTLIDTYRTCGLNGLSGNYTAEFDQALPNVDLLKRAYELYTGSDLDGVEGTGGLVLKNQHNLSWPILVSGLNITATVKSWCLVGGMPKWEIWEDVYFGRLIEQLEGEVGYSPNYFVTTLLRISDRVKGFHSSGRTIKTIYESLAAYLQGGSSKMLVPHGAKTFGFLSELFFGKRNELDGEAIFRLLKNYDFLHDRISSSCIAELAIEMNKELALPDGLKRFKKINQIILADIMPFCPSLDITRGISPSLVGG